MKDKNEKPAKKSPQPSKPVIPSYEEAWRPLKPHTTSDKKLKRGKYA